MLYTCADDFFDHVEVLKGVGRLTREEEKEYAKRYRESGDKEAKQRLVDNYLPTVASHIKRWSIDPPSLDMVYRCINILEETVEKSDFQQDNAFMNALSYNLRRAVTMYIANRD